MARRALVLAIEISKGSGRNYTGHELQDCAPPEDGRKRFRQRNDDIRGRQSPPPIQVKLPVNSGAYVNQDIADCRPARTTLEASHGKVGQGNSRIFLSYLILSGRCGFPHRLPTGEAPKGRGTPCASHIRNNG